MRLKKKDFIFIILLLTLFIIFFGTLVFTDAIFFHRDINLYYYPTKFFSTESIQNGQIPFWNPYLFCGTPFLATLQHGLFYPLSLLYYLTPFTLGFKYFFLIHFFLAGLFLYLLMRKLSMDSYCSFIAALIYILGGYLISLVNLLTTLCAVIWAPLVFLFFHQAIQKKNYFFASLVGITLTFQFFAGQPEVVYMTLFMLGFYLVSHVVYFIKEQKKEKILNEVKHTLLIFISSLAVLFLITVIQIVPFLELVRHSSRIGGLFFNAATYWSFHPLELITLIIPSFSQNLMEVENWFRQYWVRSVFIGIWPIILVILALRFKQNYKDRIFFFSLGFLSLILILGKYTPIYYILYQYIPGFNLIRYPVKFMFLVNFSLVILSGMGLQYIVDLLKEKKKRIELSIILVIMFIFFLGGLILFYFKGFQIAAILTKYFFGHLSDLQLIRLQSMYLPRIIHEYSFLIISLGFGTLLILLIYKNKLKLKAFQFLLGIIIFINLALVSFNIEPMIKNQFYKEKGEIVKYLKGEGRILLTPKTLEEITPVEPVYRGWDFCVNAYISRKSLLSCNIGWIYHLFDAGGYASMNLNRYDNFINLIRTQPTPSSSSAVNLLGVKYLISLWELNDPNLIFYAKVNRVNFYKNERSLSRVSVIPRATFVYDEREVSGIIKHSSFDPVKEIVIEVQQPRLSDQDLVEGEGKARITRYESNEIDIEADLTQAGWLLLTDTYYPGWKVYMDGIEGKIYKADYLFRAVYLNSGTHKVKFVYEPTLFREAMSITIIFIIILGVSGYFILRNTYAH